MEYNFLNNSVEKDKIDFKNSDKIHPLLLENNYSELIKAVDFLGNPNKNFLYIHGFLGTGKRQFINYLSEFLDNEVVKLEYFCGEATVCDDILLSFLDVVENLPLPKGINGNTKIETLAVKLKKYITLIKKPFWIVLHAFDNMAEKHQELVKSTISSLLIEHNVKVVISTRAMFPDILGDKAEDKKIFLKGLKKEIYDKFLASNNIKVNEKTSDEFYKETRGYYYYLAITVKILQAMKIDLREFLLKYKQSEMSFEDFLAFCYMNLIPEAIRNFFWFLRTIRHGISFNALVEFELYDEFSIQYLEENLIAFIQDETIYIQDFFLQNVIMPIPSKTEIKLRKYIIGIYEKQLKESLKTRVLKLSRQAMRNEIDYHLNCANDIKTKSQDVKNVKEDANHISHNGILTSNRPETPKTISDKLQMADAYIKDNKNTNAIELLTGLFEEEDINEYTKIEIRLKLALLYKRIHEYSLSEHNYKLAERYFYKQNEVINLNYVYYDLANLYFESYKKESAIDVIKKVVYSVDTPSDLLVKACVLLGNIYSDNNNTAEAYNYYKKAIESVTEDFNENLLNELYFKFALINDDMGNLGEAFDFYNKCISTIGDNQYKAPSYSNLGSCYFDNENYDEAWRCFIKAYEIEKTQNNYDGIYYNSTFLAKIAKIKNNPDVLKYLQDAQQSAEFISEPFYMLESTIELGDYYYNQPNQFKNALIEYMKAKNIAQSSFGREELNKILKRIDDMKARMKYSDFEEIVKKYDK